MVVIDSSALLIALATGHGGFALANRLRTVRELHAPELLDIEVLDSLRRMVAIGALSNARAQQVREDLMALRIRRYPHRPLADRAWELRQVLTPSEAMFVVLAEVLEAPLITSDPHLADTSEHGADIELIS